MKKITENIHEAYLEALMDVWHNPDYKSAPRGQPIKEKLDYTFKVLYPVSEPIFTNDHKRNDVIKAYTAKEIELYDSGTNKVEDFAKASKFWNKIANPNGTVNSAYGYLIWYNHSLGNPMFELNREFFTPEEYGENIYTPWEWAKQSLIKDKDTRQAILRFSLPEHQWFGNKDQVCTMHGNFLIRDDKLHFSVVMRSNDLMKGLVYDLPWFISLMDKMIEELQPYYPTLTKGHYTHTAHSMHIYERDEESVLKMIGIT
jgi:thymidylate synthase